MIKHLIVLPDGSEISSGPPGSGPRIKHVTTKLIVNDSQELSIGSCCAAMFECTLIVPGGELSIAAGDEVMVYRVDTDKPMTVANDVTTSVDSNGNFHVYVSGVEVAPVIDAAGDLRYPGIDAVLVDGDLTLASANTARTLVGRFTMEEPIRPTPDFYKLTAYDRVSWLDKDLTGWLLSLDEWPYTVEQMAGMVCHECGVGISAQTLLNGSYQIQRFAGQGITGRKIMQWIGQISATFCRATPEGAIEFAWYKQSERTIVPEETFSARLADYQTEPIDRVQIQLTQDDIGVIWPAAEGVTYSVTGNYLLTTTDPAALETVAGNIFNAIRNDTYTPGTVTMAHDPDINVGDIVTVRDRNGKTASLYVMTKTINGQLDTLECTGSPSRDSSTVVHEESFKAVNSKIFELRKDITGLSARAAETDTRIEDNRSYTDQKITEVTITAEGLASTVEDIRETVAGVETRMSGIEQTAESISLRVGSIEDNGVGKVATGFGLTVKESAVVIARDGAELENRLDETGMYVVRKDGTVVMQAAADGVITQNLNVRGYLDIFGMTRKQAWTDEFGRPCVATLWTGG